MNVFINTHNRIELLGRILSVREFSPGKAANITIAVKNGVDKKGQPRPDMKIDVKSFTPSSYNICSVGSLVTIVGHINAGSYKKDDKVIFTTDLVADYIEFLESKDLVDRRNFIKEFARKETAVGTEGEDLDEDPDDDGEMAE